VGPDDASMVAVPCRAVKPRSVELAKLLTSRMMPMVVVATVGPTPQIHRLWSTALALDKGLVRGLTGRAFCINGQSGHNGASAHGLAVQASGATAQGMSLTTHIRVSSSMGEGSKP